MERTMIKDQCQHFTEGDNTLYFPVCEAKPYNVNKMDLLQVLKEKQKVISFGFVQRPQPVRQDTENLLDLSLVSSCAITRGLLC